MFTQNPFAELSATISPEIMQGYVIAMVLAVIIGTVLDMMHKKSAKYFFENAQKASKSAKRTLSGGEKAGLAVQTVANEVLTSSEFANPKRRLSHLMTMYGFILFVVATVALIFGHPTSADAGVWPMVWHIGAISLAVGGYWFWFFIRVDVASEGVKWYNFNGRGDIFIVGLLSTATFALIWSGTMNMLAFVLFIASSTVLFGSVFWSKFAHMFFKPAAAYQKKCVKADGSNENLPGEYDLSGSDVQSRFPDIPEYMGTNPPNMGLGIKREPPNHF
jgi:predicted small integral membrane protein